VSNFDRTWKEEGMTALISTVKHVRYVAGAMTAVFFSNCLVH
jgi:hypothetical protein